MKFSWCLGRSGSTALWRAALLLAIALFVLTRALTLMAFPIFNDEAIYLSYSQSINDDWHENKFVSMHGEFTDWKPPLQYWITAPFIRWGNDPLLVGRAIAAFVSFLGLVGVYLFTKELFSQKEAVIAAILYVLCPAVLFNNNQFTAETFVFSTALLFYWVLLKAMRPAQPKVGWAILATLLATALLLFKQSGALLLAVAIALPFVRLRKEEGRARCNWKELIINLSVLAAVITCSHFATRLAIPSEFSAAKAHFNSRWVMSLREFSQLPTETWRANLNMVADYIGSYYSWAVPGFFCIFLWFAFQKRRSAEIALAFMCLAGGGAVIFLLRGFNEYVFNTAVIAGLMPALARTAVLIWELKQSGKVAWPRASLLVLAGLVSLNWGYQVALMGISPGKYIERSTPWAVASYLKSWSTGFGVKEIVAMLEKEKAPGLIFADTQWGNPLTSLQVYGRGRFPRLRIIPVSREFLDAKETQIIRDAAKQLGQVRYAIFSMDTSGGREQWIRNIEREMCETRLEVKPYVNQTPIAFCRF
jgi:4-amino-4-deoxy-L-arabinose transferase-like glycosyltransferase